MSNIKVVMNLFRLRTGKRAMVRQSDPQLNLSQPLEAGSASSQAEAQDHAADSQTVMNTIPEVINDDQERARIRNSRPVGKLTRRLRRLQRLIVPELTPQEQELLEKRRQLARINRLRWMDAATANKRIINAYASVGKVYHRSRRGDKFEREKIEYVHFGQWRWTEGTLYGKVDRIPNGVNAGELVDQGVLDHLSIAVGHPVGGKLDPATGVIIWISLAGTMDIENLFSYQNALKLISPSDPPLAFMVGATVNGGRAVRDLEPIPHLLIAGTTGSGKSVFLSQLVATLVARNTPATLNLLLADLKEGADMIHFEGVPHLVRDIDEIPNGVAVRNDQILPLLHWLQHTNKSRMQLFAKSKLRNIFEYNRRHTTKLPRIVFAIDELAQITNNPSTEKLFNAIFYDLASTGRSSGIHIIASTQYPKAEFIPTKITMNFSGRVCFSLPNSAQSVVVLDSNEAVGLSPSGRGVFYHGVDRFLFQAPLITDRNIHEIVENARGGKVLVDLASATELTVEEIIEWALTKNNGGLAAHDVYAAFRDRMAYHALLMLLSGMDNQIYTYQDRRYRVVPGNNNRARRLELTDGQGPEGQPGAPSQPDQVIPVQTGDVVECPNCGAPRHENPCEYCGVE
jgi:hypothetical protein